MYKIVQIATKHVNQDARFDAVKKICARFPRVESDYVLRCFERYPQVVFCQKADKVLGVFFYNFFSENSDGYFYFGPLFFFTRGAFAFGASKIVRQVLRRYPRVYFLAEVQNPELIIHLQTVLCAHIFPKPFTFAISDHARAIVRKFQTRVPQLDAVNLTTFSSQSSSSLFYRNRRSNLMSWWLERHGICLHKNQALVLLIDLTYLKFLAVNVKILFRYVTYPSHKTAYLKTIESLMRDTHENQIATPAYHTEN